MTLRTASGLSQEVLARRAEITQAALSRYENDKREPNTESVEAIAAALGTTSKLLRSVQGFEGAFMVAGHMPAGPVRGIVSWLESAGCLIVAEDFGRVTGGGKIDGLSQWVSDYPVLLINSQVPTDRLRLTLAHELGHICLHNDEPLDDAEDEANEFAAEFLMPTNEIKPNLLNLNLGKLQMLKLHWGVSMQALIERAYRLETITFSQRTFFYKAMSKRGWRKSEPRSDEPADERPELVGRMVEHLAKLEYSLSEIRELAGVASDAEDPPSFWANPGLRLVVPA